MTLAQACKFELSDDLMGVYDGAAGQNGYDVACKAINHFLINRHTNDAFPSVKDLLGVMDPASIAMLPEDESRAAAARVIKAVAKFGRTNPVQARTFVGDLGWRAIEEMGGWGSLCAQLTINNTSTYNSQLIHLCMSIYKRAQRGLLDVPPALPSLPSHQSLPFVAIKQIP